MPKVTFKNKNETKEVQSGYALKQLTREAGWNIPYACEDGQCGTCIFKIVSGGENLSPISEKEKATLEVMGFGSGEYRLACQCKINGDVTIEI